MRTGDTRVCAVRRLLPVLLAGASACAGDAGTPGESGRPPMRGGTVQLSIGSLEGADAYVFGRVSGLALHEDGRILVADAQANEVRVFSPEGAFLYGIGRAGAGPGELHGPCCLAFDQREQLWVRDGGNARYEVFRLGGDAAEFVRAVKMAHGDVNRWAPVTFDTAGRVIDIGFRPDLSGGELRTARMVLDSSGTPVGTVLVHSAPQDSVGVHRAERHTPAGPAVRYIYQPYGPQELIAHGADGYAYALSTRHVIAWYDARGELVRATTGADVSGPPLSAEERANAQKQLEASAERVGATAASFPFGVPDRKPVLRWLFFDTQGRLWAQLHVPDGAAHRADVYDADGNHLHRVQWQAGIDLSFGAIRGDTALGVASDSMGVQRVVRLHFSAVEDGP